MPNSNLTKVNIGEVRKSAPSFLISSLSDHCIIRGGAMLDLTQFLWTDGATLTVAAAGAAVDDTAIPLKPPYPLQKIPNGTVIDFGGKKFARLTAEAAIGATNLTVAALPTALIENDSATYKGVSGRYLIPGGTLLGRTYAERDAGTAFGPADTANDEEFYLSIYDVIADQDSEDDMTQAIVDLLSRDTQIAANRLPNWTTATAAYKAKVSELYQTRMV